MCGSWGCPNPVGCRCSPGCSSPNRCACRCWHPNPDDRHRWVHRLPRLRHCVRRRHRPESWIGADRRGRRRPTPARPTTAAWRCRQRRSPAHHDRGHGELGTHGRGDHLRACSCRRTQEWQMRKPRHGSDGPAKPARPRSSVTIHVRDLLDGIWTRVRTRELGSTTSSGHARGARRTSPDGPLDDLPLAARCVDDHPVAHVERHVL